MTDSNLVTALNNYAAYGQKIGAVVPYNVRIQFDMSFVEQKGWLFKAFEQDIQILY